MAVQKTRNVSYAAKPVAKKVKPGGRAVVSQALVKQGASNLIPKMHVRRGDTVMVVSGSVKRGKGKIGKILNVFPSTGMVIVEGVNIVTKATKARTPMGQSGLVKKEAPIHASKVMLYSQKSKKPVRKEFRSKEEIE